MGPRLYLDPQLSNLPRDTRRTLDGVSICSVHTTPQVLPCTPKMENSAAFHRKGNRGLRCDPGLLLQTSATHPGQRTGLLRLKFGGESQRQKFKARTPLAPAGCPPGCLSHGVQLPQNFHSCEPEVGAISLRIDPEETPTGVNVPEPTGNSWGGGGVCRRRGLGYQGSAAGLYLRSRTGLRSEHQDGGQGEVRGRRSEPGVSLWVLQREP